MSATIIEAIVDRLYSSGAGKIAIELERFADGLQVRIRIYEGAAPIYGGYVEKVGFAFNELFEDGLGDDGPSEVGTLIAQQIKEMSLGIEGVTDEG